MKKAQELVDKLNKLEREKTNVLSKLYELKVPLVINNGKIEICQPITEGAR
jgi:hypothetical protein